MKLPLNIDKFAFERSILKELVHCTNIIAIDEVGRGCLAGPVVTAASLWIPKEICCNYNIDSKIFEHQKLWFLLIRDSKRISEKKREQAYGSIIQTLPKKPLLSISDQIIQALKPDISYNDLFESLKYEIIFDIKNRYGHVCEKSPITVKNTDIDDFICLDIAIGAANVEEIDNINIWNATQLAMSRAILNLINLVTKKNDIKLFGFDYSKTIILIDGNHKILVPHLLRESQQITCIEGDANFLSIGTSSIFAKVIRDRYMTEISNLYPQYLFSKHKGYATCEHRNVIKRYAPISIHRKSFLKNIV